ncbi:hypothetical protein CBOM_06219 [Ceraceosorus bombacis]|uniref:Uncharacterized protein n=1 Tax=Ceraceosorus bombacis TaxID=401625 RepID=A0A0P1BJ98_9BASI|nr:hypothetical protein CBOM_06219 [Ceraceosorus bombacis]
MPRAAALLPNLQPYLVAEANEAKPGAGRGTTRSKENVCRVALKWPTDPS